MDFGDVDDLIYLVLTFFLAVTLTLVILIWGRATSQRKI